MRTVTGRVVKVADGRATISFRDGLHMGDHGIKACDLRVGDEVDVQFEGIEDLEPGVASRAISIRRKGVLYAWQEVRV